MEKLKMTFFFVLFIAPFFSAKDDLKILKHLLNTILYYEINEEYSKAENLIEILLVE